MSVRVFKSVMLSTLDKGHEFGAAATARQVEFRVRDAEKFPMICLPFRHRGSGRRTLLEAAGRSEIACHGNRVTVGGNL
ncbi:MAG TPA: hypothetical protein VKU19_09025 [Bryobacteraceae bacterium]|nr:hypothetical protein [Bryobacteraceae bacterium]